MAVEAVLPLAVALIVVGTPIGDLDDCWKGQGGEGSCSKLMNLKFDHATACGFCILKEIPGIVKEPVNVVHVGVH